MSDDTGLAEWARTVLGHDFRDLSLLDEALTHGSVARRQSYQRLEFLGDRVLGCIVAAWLYRQHRTEPEGRLTSRFHALVERPANAAVARGWNAARWVRMEGTTRAKGLHESENVLGDIAEAIVAAVFLDGGWDAADAFVRREWGRLASQGTPFLADPKSRLQEWALRRRRGTPIYIVIDRQGPDHAPRFTVEASVRGEPPATGDGASKQEAEKAAALALLAVVEPESAT